MQRLYLLQYNESLINLTGLKQCNCEDFADCFAVIGTVLFVIYIIFSGKEFDEFWTILFKKKKKES